MNRIYSFIITISVMLLAGAGVADDAAARADGYVIKPRDGISIRVAGYSEFNTRTTVPSDGTIFMPLIGELKAAGQTEAQLKDQIRQKLEAYIVDDINIVISITRANPQPTVRQPPAVINKPALKPEQPADGRPLSAVRQPLASQASTREHTIPADVPLSPVKPSISPPANAYIIKPNDQIIVQVWGYNEFNAMNNVTPEGTITVPLIGEVQAAGLTNNQVGEQIRQKLAQYIKGDVKLTVSVTPGFRGNNGNDAIDPLDRQMKITVIGAIVNQDHFTATKPVPLFEVLTLAGGATNDSDLQNVTIVRNSRSTLKVDVARAMETGKIGSLPEIHPGDTVYIPFKKNRGQRLYGYLTGFLSTATALAFLWTLLR